MGFESETMLGRTCITILQGGKMWHDIGRPLQRIVEIAGQHSHRLMKIYGDTGPHRGE
jgi:hypothetical protein